MSGDKNVFEVVAKLEKIHSEMRSEPDSLEELVTHVEQAAQIHIEFRKFFSQANLQVDVIRNATKDPALVKPFDWQALYKEEKSR